MFRVYVLLFLMVHPLKLTADTIYRVSDEAISKFIERDLNAGSHWYGAYYTDIEGVDHKLGHMSYEYNEILTDENNRLFEFDSNVILNFAEAGNNYEFKSNIKELYQAEPPFRLLKQQSNSRFPGLIESDFSFLSGGKVNFTKFTNGKMSNFSQEIGSIGLKDLYSVDAWLEEETINIGDIVFRNTLSEGKLEAEKYSFIGFKNQIVGGVEYDFFELSTSSHADQVIRDDIFLYKDGRSWIKYSIDFGENFLIEFRLEPKDQAIDLTNLADLYILNSIFVDHASLRFIDFFGYEQTNQKNVWYEIIGKKTDLITSNYPSQLIKTLADGRNFLVIGTGLNAFRNSDFQYEKVDSSYYDEAKLFSKNNPKLAEIASELINEAEQHKNDWSVEEEIIRSIRSFVSNLIEDEYIYYEITDPYKLLETPRGDCTEHTVLFNALLKAAGIPARSAYGYLLADESGQFSGHAWSEVAYEGTWVPVDATWDIWVENSVNYIKTINDDKLSTKDFKLRLHKIEYDDGHFEFFDNYYE